MNRYPMKRRIVIFLVSALLIMACQPIAPAGAPSASDLTKAEVVPGVTDTEIILGTHTSLTGPVAVYSAIANATKAYFDYINATEGGVHGRKLVYLLEDDGYSPPKTVELVRKLVEQDQIFALVGGLGTPTHMQVADYLQEQGVPDLFVFTGAIEWVKDPQVRPMIFGILPNYVGEGAALGRYTAQNYAGKNLGLLYQNDDAGLDTIDGFKRAVGDALPIVAEESYVATDPDLKAQVDRLKAAGAEVIGGLVTPRLLSTAIKHARQDLGWDVPFVMSQVGLNELTMKLAGAEVLEGTVTALFTHQAYELEHPGIAKHHEIIQSYSDLEEASFLTIVGQQAAEFTVEILKRSGRDLTRAGLVKTAESLTDFQCSVCLFPANLSATDHDSTQAVVLFRAEGGKFVPFGDGISWEGTQPATFTAADLQTVPSPYQ